jgi:hypothetical protein
MKFLNVECDQRNIIRMTENPWGRRKCANKKRRKNQNRPVSGGFGFVG